MAVATGSIGRRKREEQDAAARERRSRMMLIGLSVVLLAVLAFEVPKLLSHGSKSTPATATTTPAADGTAAAPATAPAVATQTPAQVRKKLSLIDRRFSPKDPFEAQLGQSAATVSARQPLATGPSVRASHFVSKDPFKAQLGVEAGDAAPAVPAQPAKPVQAAKPAKPVKPSPAVQYAAPTSGYIVVLQSLDSKSSGLAELRRAHKRGLTSAKLLYSSKYSTLRRGYWVVYVRYATAQDATGGMRKAHANGYPQAYRRVAKP